MNRIILRIAVPTPLQRLFDYLPPEGVTAEQLMPGQRLRIPFGRSRTVGVLVEIADNSAFSDKQLKRAEGLLDSTHCLPPDMLKLVLWAADYYHHAPGEALSTALPVLLRQGKPAESQGPVWWTLNELGRAFSPDQLKRAPRQAALLARLQAMPDGLADTELKTLHKIEGGDWRGALRALHGKGLVEAKEAPCLPPATVQTVPAPTLNTEQSHAVDAVLQGLGRFQPFLLEGVTGSGKTEVYLQLIEAVIAKEQQALVLVPEIGLTPQLLERFRNRFGVPIAVLHSGLNERQRLCAWLTAKQGKVPIVIGTRSAVFIPLARPGLLIVDEEHDLSFKQQEGFRYHARDLAVLRARHADIPIILGSATPSLESLHNVHQGRYTRLPLTRRAGKAVPPRLCLFDLRHQSLQAGLSPQLIQVTREHLDASGQVLVFINRRGYSPTLLCHDCGWLAECPRCDAHFTLHQSSGLLRCHHCNSQRAVPRHCPNCGSSDLRPLGQGTERIEEELLQLFPQTGISRIDRDSTRRKGAMQEKLAQANSGEAQILVGTQMLAKGHHFPNVTLAVILDADQGLFSTDFRAAERLAQLITQVAGRAGRTERPGEVVIQTHNPDHPFLTRLLDHGYGAFAEAALTERREAQLPPYTLLALLRAEAATSQATQAFLHAAYQAAQPFLGAELQLFGPIPAPMPRKAGRHRAQLLLQAPQRRPLHIFLSRWLKQLDALKEARKVRWSIDVDPMETG